MVAVEITAPALADIKAIVAYVHEQSAQNAQDLQKELFQKIASLKTFPERGQIVREMARDDIREIRLFHYRIIYQLDWNVRVLTIHHAARLLTNNPNLKNIL